MKKEIVIVPYSAIPHQVWFRHQRAWWKKIVGSMSMARIYRTTTPISLNARSLVAVRKKDLPSPNHWVIVREFEA